MPQNVVAPAIFSTKHNLLDTARKRTSQDDRWENGVSFTPEGCEVAFAQEAGCPPNLKSGFQECAAPVTFQPFTVEVAIEFTAKEDDDYLNRLLDVKTSSAVERAAWDGVITAPTNPKFADVTAGTDTMSARSAIGLLESKLLESGQQGGTVHLSPYDASLASGLFVEIDGMLQTKTARSLVVIGNYPKGSVFIHGGEIDVYVSEKFTVKSHDDIGRNKFLSRVERMVLVAWNPCHTFMETYDNEELVTPGYEEALEEPTPVT